MGCVFFFKQKTAYEMLRSLVGSEMCIRDRLKAELSQMLAEHKSIVAALERLSEAAKKAGKMEYAEFAEALMLHAKTEEEVLYPASILIGEYVREKLGLR